jgi:hypothetical protein
MDQGGLGVQCALSSPLLEDSRYTLRISAGAVSIHASIVARFLTHPRTFRRLEHPGFSISRPLRKRLSPRDVVPISSSAKEKCKNQL